VLVPSVAWAFGYANECVWVCRAIVPKRGAVSLADDCVCRRQSGFAAKSGNDDFRID